jgi:Heterokaryon incompatibility protein (HET)
LTCTLDNVSDYSALSYCWGDEKIKQEILVRGVPVLVTRNFSLAVKHLRPFKEPLDIWIDALCIDQDSTEEKNCQVLLMCEIYQRAKLVIAWIGEEDDDTEMALQLIRSWAVAYQEHHHLHGSRSPLDDPAICQKVHENLVADRWDAIRRLYRKPYWTRIWVVQEVCVAEHVFFHCGEQHLPLQLLAHFESMVYSLLSPINHARISGRAFNNTVSVFVLFRETSNVFTLIELTRSHGCKDPRDKVPALLGLLPEVSFKVDYKQSVSQVYTRFASNIIRSKAEFSLLTFGSIQQYQRKNITCLHGYRT